MSFDYTALTEEDKFAYLAEKLFKWINVDAGKVCIYWLELVKLPFDHAPHDLIPVYKAAKEYIKREMKI